MTPLIAHELARPDATIRYWASPEPVSSSAPTLVLLHGATLDHRAWDVQVAALLESYPVVVPDLRAHGESTGAFCFRAAVDDVSALLDVLPADDLVLIGLSLGANIAQELVRQDPGRFQALVLADATCNNAAHPPMAAAMGISALRWQALVAGSGFADQVARATAKDPVAQRYAREANAHRSNDETIDILASLLTHALRPDPGYRLPVPTLLMHGEDDCIGDIRRATARWARREPLAEYAVIPAAGHTSNLDNPAAFTSVLQEFLGRVAPSGHDRDAIAERLYARYGSRPWELLPEATREHFRGLVEARLDGTGAPLEQAG
jgi:3-oxoadipate enol-lactonase